jgi:hypothetical protein
MSASLADDELAGTLREILGEASRLLDSLPNQRRDLDKFDLMDLPDRVQANLTLGVVRGHQDRLLRRANGLIEHDDGDGDPQSRMRDLTGAWLGLYFLGTPFPQPWEPVARHAERNGYYHDGGIFKAAGDVYRRARKGSERRDGQVDQALLLLDLNPLAFKGIVGRGVASAALADLVPALGTCYEMLQLRLYIRAGLPIAHVIPVDTLRSLVKRDLGNVESMCGLAKHAYGELPPQRGQSIMIVEAGRAAYRTLSQMSGCVLAEEVGIYRSKVASESTHGGRNGNRLIGPQHRLYRDTLRAAVRAEGGVRRVADEADLRAFLTALASTAEPPAAQPPP